MLHRKTESYAIELRNLSFSLYYFALLRESRSFSVINQLRSSLIIETRLPRIISSDYFNTMLLIRSIYRSLFSWFCHVRYLPRFVMRKHYVLWNKYIYTNIHISIRVIDWCNCVIYVSWNFFFSNNDTKQMYFLLSLRETLSFLR